MKTVYQLKMKTNTILRLSDHRKLLQRFKHLQKHIGKDWEPKY